MGAVVKEIGVSAETLERWRSEAVLATAGMSEEQKSVRCREHGTVPTELASWGEAATAALEQDDGEPGPR